MKKAAFPAGNTLARLSRGLAIPFLYLAVTGLLAVSSASAQQFLGPQDQNLSQILPPPPADNSPAGLADLDTLLQIQKERTPEQVARAKRVNTQSVFGFARPVFGEWFQRKDFPRTAAIFEVIDREERDVVEAAKRTSHRPRPYQRDARIVPVVPKPGNDSYPSGHTSNAAVWAAVLTAAFPEHAAAFQDQVHETMWCRELGGVHYPTDTESGFLIGKAIGERMLAAPAMQKALEDIRAEVTPFQLKKAAGLTPAPPADGEKVEMPPG